ncbi:MAG: OmpA family protein [Candidatus Eiseniibacteriota bacterium]|nr:MAG: OmpA family protein [Candidatus Eisenbacteria bacterium]
MASLSPLLSQPGGVLVFPPGEAGRNILLVPSPAPEAPLAPPLTPDTTAADTLAPDTLALATAALEPDTAAAGPEPVALRITAAGAETLLVEREILETGLFRAVNIIFEVGRATLLPPSLSTLNSLAYVLVKYPDLRLEVAGHSDSSGPDEFNLRLSQIRAEAVRDYLTQNFPIAPGRLVARGYGESRPVASNDTATGRGLNRRVEFVVLQQETK